MSNVVFYKSGHPVTNGLSRYANNNHLIQAGGFSIFPFKNEIYFVIDIRDAIDSSSCYMDTKDSSRRIQSASNIKIECLDRFYNINGVKIEYDSKGRVIKVGRISITYNISEPYVPYEYVSVIKAGGTTYKYDWRESRDSDEYYVYRISESSTLGTSFGGLLVISK